MVAGKPTMTKCEWGHCTAEAKFTIRYVQDTPTMRRAAWAPRWCYAHVISVLRKSAANRRAYRRRRATQSLVKAGLPNYQADLRERVRCVDCGRSTPLTKALCCLSRKSVRKCAKHERTHGLDPCQAYCRDCAPWLRDDGSRNAGYLCEV